MGSRHTYRCWTVTRHSTFYNIKKSTIMATNIKKATIVAMAAITGATVQSETQAMQVAMQDMAQEYGKSAIIIDINPFDGLIA